jgi:hypothetical protein
LPVFDISVQGCQPATISLAVAAARDAGDVALPGAVLPGGTIIDRTISAADALASYGDGQSVETKN